MSAKSVFVSMFKAEAMIGEYTIMGTFTKRPLPPLTSEFLAALENSPAWAKCLAKPETEAETIGALWADYAHHGIDYVLAETLKQQSR